VTEDLLLTRWSMPLRVLFLVREGQMSEHLADTAVEQVKSIVHMIWQHLPPTASANSSARAVSWADRPSSSPARCSAFRSTRFPLTPLGADVSY